MSDARPPKTKLKPKRKLVATLWISEHHLARLALAAEFGEEWARDTVLWTRKPNLPARKFRMVPA